MESFLLVMRRSVVALRFAVAWGEPLPRQADLQNTSFAIAAVNLTVTDSKNGANAKKLNARAMERSENKVP
jgi:hypothetical protein